MVVGSPPSSRAAEAAGAGSLYDGGMDNPRPRPSRRRLIVAVVVIALLLIVGGALFLNRDRTPTPSASPPAAPAPTSSAPSPSTSAAPTQAGSDAVPTATPQDVTWTLFRGLALPSSPSAGPTRVDGPVYAGYAHTPEGALIAATQISARNLVTPDGGWRQVLNAQVVDTPGRDAYANLRAQTTDALPTAGLAQYAGFRFATYTPDVAVISLGNKNSNGTYQVANTTVKWVDEDWKLEIPPSGLAQPQTVQSLVGYVPWSGVA